MEILLGVRRGTWWQADRRRRRCSRLKGVFFAFLIPAPPARRPIGNKREISEKKKQIFLKSNFALQALFAAARRR